MKLKQLKLQNFRGYKDETVIDFDDLVVLVGKNDAGKSSLFDALDIFFEIKPAPDQEDLCVHSDDTDIRISCVFTDFPSQLVIDALHPTDLASEHLLNVEGHLEIIKIYDCKIKKPRGSVFARARHPTADDYGDLHSLNISELRKRASELEIDLSKVNKTVKAALRGAVWNNAKDLVKCEVCVSLAKGSGKEIWDQLRTHLPVYALFKSDRPSTDQDAEAQDPMKLAVKEAIETVKVTLEEIEREVKENVQRVARRTVEKIKEMDVELANQLEPHVTTKPWHTLFSLSLTGDDEIHINKRGSGTRRLVLLNFFRAKAEEDAERNNSGVIYAIEEPETTQHPHNQVMLVKALADLAEQHGNQVFLSTHSPMLAHRFKSEALRFVTKNASQPIIRHGSDESTMQEIVDSLGILPDHNVMAFYGVEGGNDITFLRTISKMLSENKIPCIPDLGEAEDSGRLFFVPMGGSNLGLWVSRLEGLRRPEFYLVDSDKKSDPKVHELRERENVPSGSQEKENWKIIFIQKLSSVAIRTTKGQAVAQRMSPNCLLKLSMRLVKAMLPGNVLSLMLKP